MAEIMTVRRLVLGTELRRLRENAGMTMEQAGEVLYCSDAKISRIETGFRGIRRLDLQALLDAYGVIDEHRREALCRLSRQSRKPDWWDTYGEVLADGQYRDFLSLENDAVWIRTYETMFLYGLLQIEDYARAIFVAGRPGVHYNEIEALVQARMHRQSILTRPEPVKLWTVLDESTLRRQVGGRAVHLAQLRKLLEIADGALPSVTLQVLPFEVGAHAGNEGSFTLFAYTNGGGSDLVWLENLSSSIYLGNTEDVARYSLAFDHIKASALSPAESRDLIAKVAKET